MKYYNPVKFVNPKTPAYGKGYLVIETDDGNRGDYTHWLTLVRRLKSEYSQWADSRCIVVCPDINTRTLGQPNKMTVEMVKKLYHVHGWEILSHGTYHIGVGKHKLLTPAPAGSTVITVQQASYLGHTQDMRATNFDYLISDGVNSEIKKIIDYNYPNNQVTLSGGLHYSYGVDAHIQLTETSMTELLQGCVEDLASWGIPCGGHVFTFHAGTDHVENAEAINLVGNIFDSARGSANAVNRVGQGDRRNLSAYLAPAFDHTLADTLLSQVANDDSVVIIYGHGETLTSVLDIVEHWIRVAFSKGVRIVTRSEAVKHLFG